MNILVVGNGYDLALGLPTSYINFLDFAYAFDFAFPAFITKSGSNNIVDSFEKAVKGSICTTYRIPSEDMQIDVQFAKKIFKNYKHLKLKPQLAKYIKDFHKCIYNNPWVQYFQYQYKNNLLSGENWIDIENEVKRVIDFVENHEQYGDESIIKIQSEKHGSDYTQRYKINIHKLFDIANRFQTSCFDRNLFKKQY